MVHGGVTMKKTVISSAVLSVLGVTTTAVGAAPVTGFTIRDVGSNTINSAGNYSSALDGISGAFKFHTSYLNANTYGGASLFTGDVGTGTIQGGGAANPTGSFTTGFMFGASTLVPFTSTLR